MRRFWRERNGRFAQLAGEEGEKSEIRVSLSAGSFVGNSEEIRIDDVDESEELEEAHDGMLEMSVIQKVTHWLGLELCREQKCGLPLPVNPSFGRRELACQPSLETMASCYQEVSHEVNCQSESG
ncbi:hypothetical protein Peur_009440 [Populus x canadensis]